MKLSEQWLHEWIEPTVSREALAAKLTMAGLEVDGLVPVAEHFTNVIVAEVLQVEKHPEADRLSVCQVNVGQSEPLTIVCGAANVRPNLKVAAALVGAILPNDFKISRSKIRNVVSNGMLCSSRELGMADESAGIMELPQNAPIGVDIRQYLNLSDYVFDIAITPNRGDCLSVMGIAKEVAAITASNIKDFDVKSVGSVIQDVLTVAVDLPAECPRYAGRVIKNIKADALTPIWLQERLHRSGIRSISAIVDVMNYVMLELGQPMHAFDLAKISGGIKVRKAELSDSLTLLDGQTLALTIETMVIADEQEPLAIAGVMGGLNSGVTLLTQDIFLESAYFNPKSIAYAARHFNIGSESSYRFERGIDPLLQSTALERATQLILDIAGGEPGPVVDVMQEHYLPKPVTIVLRSDKVNKLLGLTIESAQIESILQKLGFSCVKNQAGWDVTVPARRSDITLEVDLIEEIMRLYGYDQLPLQSAYASLQINPASEDKLTLQKLRRICCDLGYHEVITYSFVDKSLQHQFDPEHKPKELVNPITADMTVMRTNLWPGLMNTYLYNRHRQQSRVRIFETGLRFILNNETELSQERVLSGLVSGAVFPEQWGSSARDVDFFDLKGDIERLLRLTTSIKGFVFKTGSHPALHPGQAADVYRHGVYVGVFGALHPQIKQSFGITENVLVFELMLDPLELFTAVQYREFSKFPEIRRDIAIFLDQSVPSQAIQDTIVEVGGELLRDVTLFDVYQGKGIAPHQKSIALALTLQHDSRTLVDEEVAGIIENIIAVLKQRFAAELRG